jgi:thiol:disulfide interchange protein
MRPKPRSFSAAGLFGVAVLALAATAAVSSRAAAQYTGNSPGWLEGASGYSEAAKLSKSSGTPMFVYFRTDWCPYCKEFESELLSSPKVEAYLRELVRVKINPETGQREGKLADAYNVQGYPGLYWQKNPGEAPVRITRTTRTSSGESRLKTPDEFIAGIRQAATQ